jgi:hypothetical protein
MTREEIIRILLVDDVELIRHTLRTILGSFTFRNCGRSLRRRGGSHAGPTMRSRDAIVTAFPRVGGGHAT